MFGSHCFVPAIMADALIYELQSYAKSRIFIIFDRSIKAKLIHIQDSISINPIIPHIAMKRVLIMIFVALAVMSADAAERKARVRNNVPLDSIVLSDPCVLADSATMTYYMTGTGGLLWKSRDLRLWDGPYRVAETDDESWMCPTP